MKKTCKSILFLAFILGYSPLVAQLYINEFMLRNQTDILDVFGESDDWLEIYNGGTSVVNLAGYYFSDDPAEPLKFQIPADQGPLFVLPNNYLILWPDRDPEQGLDHLDIRLSSDGESLLITEADGITLVDQILDFPAQAPNVSYGRTSDGASDWTFFSVNTYDEANSVIEPEGELLVINEVLNNNVNNIVDQAGEHESWFEIYNPNNYAVNVANYWVGIGGSPLVQIQNTDPVRTVIEGDGHIILYVDGDLDQGSNHIEGSFAGSGDLVLYAPDASTEVSTFGYYPLSPDISWGRSVDAGSSFIEFDIPTPRVTNSLIIIEPEPLFINEVLSDNATDLTDPIGDQEDWIEIYNPNTYAVNLGGYHLSDNPDVPNKYQIPTDDVLSTTIPPMSWMIFYADEDTQDGPLHVSFRLSADGEEVTLYSPDAFSVADKVVFGPIDEDVSYGRIQDGADEWIFFSGTTPNATNAEGTISVEEVLSPKNSWKIQNSILAGEQRISWHGQRDVAIYTLGGRLVETVLRAEAIQFEGLPAGLYLLKTDLGETAKIVKR